MASNIFLSITSHLLLQTIILQHAPVPTSLAFSILPSHPVRRQSHFLASSPNPHSDDENNPDSTPSAPAPPLVIGNDMRKALETIATEAGYLDAAKKRNQEAKLKLMEQIRQEELEAERVRKEMEEKGNRENYGPGDLSSFVGFKDDGFEASEGNDGQGGWVGVVKTQEAEEKAQEEEEPKLFLFGNENDDDKNGGSGGIITSGSGLIL